jgi:hypothetical protein
MPACGLQFETVLLGKLEDVTVRAREAQARPQNTVLRSVLSSGKHSPSETEKDAGFHGPADARRLKRG